MGPNKGALPFEDSVINVCALNEINFIFINPLKTEENQYLYSKLLGLGQRDDSLEVFEFWQMRLSTINFIEK